MLILGKAFVCAEILAGSKRYGFVTGQETMSRPDNVDRFGDDTAFNDHFLLVRILIDRLLFRFFKDSAFPPSF